MAAIYKGFDIPAEMDTIGDFRWWKLGGNKVLKLVIASHEPVFYRGHYVGKRMYPCNGDNCAWCAKRLGAQVRCVLAAAEMDTNQMGLIEVGRSVALEIIDLVGRHGQLRGMGIELSRVSYSRQSRMEVDYVDREFGKWWYELPIPDVTKALEMTWKRQGSPREAPPEEEPDPNAKPWDKHLKG